MTRSKKTFVLILSMICMFVSFAFPCYAANQTVIMPRWNNVSNVITALDFYDDGVGVASVSVGKGNTATSLEGTLTVYEYDDGEWIVVDSVSGTTTRNTLFLSFEFDCISGVEYKLEIVITAYTGTTIIEEITDTKTAKCP